MSRCSVPNQVLSPTQNEYDSTQIGNARGPSVEDMLIERDDQMAEDTMKVLGLEPSQPGGTT